MEKHLKGVIQLQGVGEYVIRAQTVGGKLNPSTVQNTRFFIGVRGFPARGYFIPGRDGGGPGGREKFRVVVAVVARPGPGPGSALPRGSKT